MIAYCSLHAYCGISPFLLISRYGIGTMCDTFSIFELDGLLCYFVWLAGWLICDIHCLCCTSQCSLGNHNDMCVCVGGGGEGGRGGGSKMFQHSCLRDFWERAEI